jgi:hypothetical protein
VRFRSTLFEYLMGNGNDNYVLGTYNIHTWGGNISRVSKIKDQDAVCNYAVHKYLCRTSYLFYCLLSPIAIRFLTSLCVR